MEFKCKCGRIFTSKKGLGNHKNFCKYFVSKEVLESNKNKRSLAGKKGAQALKNDEEKYNLWKKKISIETKKAMKRPEVLKKFYSAPQFNKNSDEYNEWKRNVREKTKEKMQKPEIRKKVSEKTKEAMKRPEVKANMRFQYRTDEWNIMMLDKYGDKNFNNSEKAKQTKEKKYGNRNSFDFGSKEFKSIMKQKYGVENWMQAEEYNYLHSKENHWNWKGGICNDNLYLSEEWKNIRKKVYVRDNFKCQCCGSNRNILAHHIIPYRISKNNNISNLITLCNECHPKIEHKTSTLLENNENINITEIINDFKTI